MKGIKFYILVAWLSITMVQTAQGQFYVNYLQKEKSPIDSLFSTIKFFESTDGKQFSIGNSADNSFVSENEISHIKTISRMRSNRVEVPEGSNLKVENLTIYSDGKKVDVNTDGYLEPCLGDIVVFNGHKIVYLSYGEETERRILNAEETAVSLLIYHMPLSLTENSDNLWVLKLMISRLDETRELSKAIELCIKEKSYLDMDAVFPQYLKAVAEIEKRLGYETSSLKGMRRAKSVTFPNFVYGGKECRGDGFTIVKEKSLWGEAKSSSVCANCWHSEFTLFNADRFCYTSVVKAKKNANGMFSRINDNFFDTFQYLIKPMNLSACMDFGTLSDIVTNPEDIFVHLSDPDFDRVINQFWEPLKNLGHVLKGEDTETTSYDKIKVSDIKFELYPDNEHLMVVGPGMDNRLMAFNILKIAFLPVMKLIVKEVKKGEEYKNSDFWDKVFIGFVQWVSETDPTFCTKLVVKFKDPSLSWKERVSGVIELIDDKFTDFVVEDIIIHYISKTAYKYMFSDLKKGFEDPQIKAIFMVYKTILTAGNILQLILDANYQGCAFEIDYGPSYEGYYNYQKETFTVNDVPFTMVKLPGGPFMMGAQDDDKDAYSWEKPAHAVTLSKFSIGETEVTQALWKAVMGNNPSKFLGDNKPVDNVSWLDCQEFITKLNALTGRSFRLPTEAEWEFAASGGLYSRGFKYSGSDDANAVMWHSGNSGKETHPVRLKDVNLFGLYDMSGNVMEWCQDFYDVNYYQKSPEEDPCNDVTADLFSHAIRGGSWNSEASYCRVTARRGNAQAVKSEIFGLRLAMDENTHPNKDGQIVMERKYKVHHGGNYHEPQIILDFGNKQVLHVGYLKMNWWGDYSHTKHGIHIIAGDDWSKANEENVWYIAPTIADEWVTEKLIVDLDGKVQYYMNGQYMGEKTFTGIDLSNAKMVSIQARPFGWWTGHSHYMDDFSLTTPFTSISDDFNDGVLDTNIWLTPVNPDGVREEDGILKMEMLRTDQDFDLRSKPIPLFEEEILELCPDNNHPHTIDLGLPSGALWACCNVGATKPEENGDYFAWGETEPKENYSWGTYKWCNGNQHSMNKYCYDSAYGIIDNKTVLELEDDAAYMIFGSEWRMPTKEEQDEFRENCDWEWTIHKGVMGMKVKSRKNDVCVFLPACGYRSGNSKSYVSEYGYYQSASLDMTNSDDSYYFYFNSAGHYWQDFSTIVGRDVGFSVRPVRMSNQNSGTGSGTGSGGDSDGSGTGGGRNRN